MKSEVAGFNAYDLPRSAHGEGAGGVRARITAIDGLLAGLPREQRALVEQLYEIRSSIGRLQVPDEFASALANWYRDAGDDDAMAIARAEAQQLVRTRCRWSGEAALFNPLRGQRPQSGGAAVTGDEALERQIDAAADSCDFCDPERRTTHDTWGRVAGRHAVTAANASKYDEHHGLVIARRHHPLEFGRDEVRDYLATARQWLERTRLGRNLPHALIGWNCLPRSGASLIHGHMQVLANDFGPYGRQAALVDAAAAYQKATGRGFWQDRLTVHEALGLGDRRDGVGRFVSLTPVKNREVILISERFDDPFADAMCDTLRTLIDELGVRCFNAAVYPAALDGSSSIVVGRCVDRGHMQATSSDIGAMEMYGAPIISADPFVVAANLFSGRREAVLGTSNLGGSESPSASNLAKP